MVGIHKQAKRKNEAAAFESLVKTAMDAAIPEQERVKAQYIEDEAPKLVEHSLKKGKDLSLENAQKTVRARIEGGKHRDQYQDDVIIFDKFGPVSVSEILKNSDKFDKASACDPQEPELGKGKAKFYSNGKEGKPFIHSFAHGGIKYFLHDDPAPDPGDTDKWSIEDAVCHIQHIAGESVDILKVLPVVEDILTHQSFTPMELNLIRDECKTRLKISKGAIDDTINQKGKNASGNDDPLTHVEMSDKFLEHLNSQHLALIGAENALWPYIKSTGLFTQKELTAVEIEIGRRYKGEKNCVKGSDYKAIARLVYNSVADVNFFRDAPYGLPGATEFYQIIQNEIKTRKYSPDLRARWKLASDPAPVYSPGKAPLLQKYLDFALDEPQQELFQEVVGALLTGCMSSLQKAALLLGPGNNGKSVALDLLSHAFPRDLQCSIKPDKMSEDYFKAMLAGKIINIIGEIDDTLPIKADFKDIVASDTPLTARLPYAQPFEFLPQAGHIFASNAFPMTKDHSNGFYRRWVVIEFKNKVTPEMKIPRLGQKIAENEMDQFLAWGLEGAQRLIQNNFTLTETKQHTGLMDKWQNVRDSVFNFLNDDEAVQYIDGVSVLKTTLYKIYADWAKYSAGVRPVGRNNFYERAALKLPEKRYGNKRYFVGIAVTEWKEGAGLLQCHDANPECYANHMGAPF